MNHDLLSRRIYGLHFFLCLLLSPFLFFLLLLTLDELTKDVLAWHNASKWEGHFYYLIWMFYISALSSRLLKTNKTWQYGLIFFPRRCRIKSREDMSHPWNGIFFLRKFLVIIWIITNNIVIIKCKLLSQLYICKVGMDQGPVCRFLLSQGNNIHVFILQIFV